MRRALLAAAAGFVSAAALAATPDWITRASKAAVPPELLSVRPAPDAVVLWDQQIITASAATGSTKLFRRHAVRILTVGGSSAGTFEEAYDDDSRVDIEGAWSLHGDGTTEELKLRDVVTTQLANPEYFTDTQMLYFRPPRLAPGDVAAFALSRKSRRDVHQWILPLQRKEPVVGEQIVIDLPAGWRHRWRLTRAPEGYSGPLSGDGSNQASYPFGPQRALPEEASAPPEADLPAQIEIALIPPAGSFGNLAFAAWNDVASWFERKSVPARGAVPAALRVPGTSPLADCARWVQEKVRYVALEVGEGGYVARPPALVAQRLFGDCKDKAFLLIALLKRNGIEAYPVLARPRDFGSVDPGFPSPVQFDHLVVAVRPPKVEAVPGLVKLPDGPAVIFDPTDPWTPFGELPQGLQGTRALVVENGSGILVELPYADGSVNSQNRTVDAALDRSGRLSASVTDTTRGTRCQRDIYQSMPPLKRTESLARGVERAIPGSTLSGLTLEHLDDRDQPLEARYSVTAPGYLHHAGGVWLLSVLPFPMGPHESRASPSGAFRSSSGSPGSWTSRPLSASRKVSSSTDCPTPSTRTTLTPRTISRFRSRAPRSSRPSRTA